MVGVGMDFSATLALPAEAGPGPRTLFYPGSSIGNFTPADALAFLRQAHAECAGGALVIGVDLVKDRAVLEPAYDDPLQVTAAFNRNMLLHFNRLAGTDFRLADWTHHAFFNQVQSRIEMHLVAGREPHGGLARRRTPLSQRRNHPYRKFIQVAHRRFREPAGSRGIPRGAPLDR